MKEKRIKVKLTKEQLIEKLEEFEKSLHMMEETTIRTYSDTAISRERKIDVSDKLLEARKAVVVFIHDLKEGRFIENRNKDLGNE